MKTKKMEVMVFEVNNRKQSFTRHLEYVNQEWQGYGIAGVPDYQLPYRVIPRDGIYKIAEGTKLSDGEVVEKQIDAMAASIAGEITVVFPAQMEERQRFLPVIIAIAMNKGYYKRLKITGVDRKTLEVATLAAIVIKNQMEAKNEQNSGNSI